MSVHSIREREEFWHALSILSILPTCLSIWPTNFTNFTNFYQTGNCMQMREVGVYWYLFSNQDIARLIPEGWANTRRCLECSDPLKEDISVHCVHSNQRQRSLDVYVSHFHSYQGNTPKATRPHNNLTDTWKFSKREPKENMFCSV